MALLNREAILNAQDLPTEVVPVPEWGGDVLVRGLNGTDRDKFEMGSVEMKDGKVVDFKRDNVRARLVGLCIVDEQGNRVFSDADIEALGRKSGTALDRVFDVAQRLSGIGKKAQEEARKNS